jgi:hypothetical protein
MASSSLSKEFAVVSLSFTKLEGEGELQILKSYEFLKILIAFSWTLTIIAGIWQTSNAIGGTHRQWR